MELVVSLASAYKPNYLLAQLHPYFLVPCPIRLIVDFRNASFVNPVSLTIITGFIQFIESIGHLESIHVERGPKVDSYVSRMNFYSLIGYDNVEWFQRHDSKGRFLEMCPVNKDNAPNTIQALVEIVEQQILDNRWLSAAFNYLLYEIVDNAMNHASSPTEPIVVAQAYQNRIEFGVVDCGKGIRCSLAQNPTYKGLSSSDALRLCIELGVTRDQGSGRDGMGRGLYETASIVAANSGNLSIWSLGGQLSCSGKSAESTNGYWWQGTIVYGVLQRNNLLDEIKLKDIFGDRLRDKLPVTIEDKIYEPIELW